MTYNVIGDKEYFSIEKLDLDKVILRKSLLCPP